MLCSLCQGVLAQENRCAETKPSGHRLTHHSTCATLKHSVERGCYVCNRLWANLALDERQVVSASGDSTADDGDDEEVGVEAKFLEAEDTSADYITASSLSDGQAYGYPGCYLWELAFNTNKVVVPDKTQDRAFWRAAFLLSPNNGLEMNKGCGTLSSHTNSNATLTLARRWITDCAAHHQQCKTSSRENRFYPTRLLDCGSPGASDIRCHLIEPSIAATDEPYITLSHCWGVTDSLKLTTENYGQLLNGISMSLLPKLYQDVVHIAHQLNVRYLWIDALCIIQQGDQLADWQREVALMRDVYSNSFCNISAANVPDSHHSMFRSRDPEALHPDVVYLSVNGLNTTYLVSDIRLWDTDVSRAVVNTRAWVLQERLLAPRIVHFGASQVFWECREKDAAEVYPDGLPVDIFPAHKRLKDLTSDRGEDEQGCKLWAYQSWIRIVQIYSACALTFPSDKLVAISGIAAMMEAVLCDEYIAGMWRRHLEKELLWSRVDMQSAIPAQPQTYRAPSWSWAAVDGEINPGCMEVGPEDILIKVVSLRLKHMEIDKMSLAEGSRLRLLGYLKQLVLLPYTSAATKSNGDWIMVVNGVQVSRLTNSTMREPQPHVKLDASHVSFEKQNKEASLYCMPGRKRSGDSGSIYILLLELVNRERGIFRRIGLARGWDKAVIERMLSHHVMESQFPCEEYKDGKHLISLV
ncbi:hypothetical protein CRV24_009323 [Beauveria bassiana]|nr:hypothetical protein CRV24_009323 [Beauveria bassiana]